MGISALKPKAISASITLVAVLVAVVSFGAAPAAAEVRTGSATDGVESGPGSNERILPGQDIVAVSASYDTVAGTINVAVTTHGPPTSAHSYLLVRFSAASGGECVRPRAFIGAEYSASKSDWLTEGPSGEQSAEAPGTKSVSGNTTTLVATAPGLAGMPYVCVEPFVLDTNLPKEEQTIEGLLTGLIISGPPPTPTPAPAPTPPPAPAPVPKVAKLGLAPLKALSLKRYVWKKLKIGVTNSGTATAAKLSLSVGKAPGVVVKPKSRKIKLKPIAPGKSRTASFQVLLTKKAKASTKLALKIRGAKGAKLDATVRLKLPRKRKPPKKGQEPTKASLGPALYYAYEMHPSESATLIGYAFLDDTWAYHGIPSGGLPHCTEVTGSADKEGCVKYTYDPKSGAIQIGSLGGGKIGADGSFEIDGEEYSPTFIPPAGARYQFEQEYITYYGICGLITGCSTSHEKVILNSAGEFVLTRESLTTSGGSGPGETFVAAGSYPADQHGTYAIEPNGRITLAFADGTSRAKTIAILLKEGKPDPVHAGLLLDSSYFLFLGDE